MKGFLRWMLKPVVRWLSNELSQQVGEYEDGGMFFCITDGFGNRFELERTPDQIRDRAWMMIGMADDAENPVYQD